MNLSDLCRYKRVCIQCHNQPDADALASGYALWRYFSEAGCEATLLYGGKHDISKPSLRKMCENFEIPVEHAQKLPDCDLLVTVDCQYGEANVECLPCAVQPQIAIIDHHVTELENSEFVQITSCLGSCSTVVWELLKQAPSFVPDKSVMTALYYGLYCDTCEFKELFHPKDRDMRDDLSINRYTFLELVNSSLSRKDVLIISEALKQHRYLKEFQTAVVPVETNDPNILGIVGDFLEQIDEINLCVAYCRLGDGYKLSARSCSDTTKANDFLEHLCGDSRRCGGHKTKAGGFLPYEALAGQTIEAVLYQRIKNYFETYELIDALSYTAPLNEMQIYKKKPCVFAAACSTDILSEGTAFLVRELEGDLEHVASPDLFFVVGICGEVYYMSKEKFDIRYDFIQDKQVNDYDKVPSIRNLRTGDTINLNPYLRTCISKDNRMVYAKQLTRGVKVLTAWDRHNYFRGKAGDYLVASWEEPNDVYIVHNQVFQMTYKPVSPAEYGI